MSHLQKFKNENPSAQIFLVGQGSAVIGEEMTRILLAGHQNQETSLMMTSDEKKAQITQNSVSRTVEQQELETAVFDKPNFTSVTVFSPQKNGMSPDHLEINLRLLGKRSCSNP